MDMPEEPLLPESVELKKRAECSYTSSGWWAKMDVTKLAEIFFASPTEFSMAKRRLCLSYSNNKRGTIKNSFSKSITKEEV
jgi:hypothetical protein